VKHARLWESQGLENWAVLNLCRNLSENEAQRYAKDLADCCNALGECLDISWCRNFTGFIGMERESNGLD
jgi:hypothetical protein